MDQISELIHYPFTVIPFFRVGSGEICPHGVHVKFANSMKDAKKLAKEMLRPDEWGNSEFCTVKIVSLQNMATLHRVGTGNIEYNNHGRFENAQL